MSTKKKPKKRPSRTKARAKTQSTGPKIEARAKLRGLSVGAGTCGLGFEFSREVVSLEEADAVLVGARLDVSIDAEKGQEEMFDGAIDRVQAVADVHRVSVGRETFGARLTFARDDVEVDSLAAFAGKEATLTLVRTGAVADDEPADVPEDATVGSAE